VAGRHQVRPTRVVSVAEVGLSRRGPRHAGGHPPSRRPCLVVASRDRLDPRHAAARQGGSIAPVGEIGTRYNRSMRPCLTALAVCLLTGVAQAQPAGLGIGGAAATNPIELTDARVTDTFFPVAVNHWWGLMNQHGQLVIPLDFDWADHSYEGITRVVRDGLTY